MANVGKNELCQGKIPYEQASIRGKLIYGDYWSPVQGGGDRPWSLEKDGKESRLKVQKDGIDPVGEVKASPKNVRVLSRRDQRSDLHYLLHTEGWVGEARKTGRWRRELIKIHGSRGGDDSCGARTLLTDMGGDHCKPQHDELNRQRSDKHENERKRRHRISTQSRQDVRCSSPVPVVCRIPKNKIPSRDRENVF